MHEDDQYITSIVSESPTPIWKNSDEAKKILIFFNNDTMPENFSASFQKLYKLLMAADQQSLIFLDSNLYNRMMQESSDNGEGAEEDFGQMFSNLRSFDPTKETPKFFSLMIDIAGSPRSKGCISVTQPLPLPESSNEDRILTPQILTKTDYFDSLDDDVFKDALPLV